MGMPLRHGEHDPHLRAVRTDVGGDAAHDLGHAEDPVGRSQGARARRRDGVREVERTKGCVESLNPLG